MRKNKRTRLDFSKHELSIIDNEHVTIHTLSLPNSSLHKFIFINCKGVLTVTGDYGNWVFCREFHPKNDTQCIDDVYWCEKLSIGSIQEPFKYSSEATSNEIKRLTDEGGLEEYYGEVLEIYPIKEKLIELSKYTDNEIEYTYKAFIDNDEPFIDYDDIPFEKVMNGRLSYIFDAFEEICSRL